MVGMPGPAIGLFYGDNIERPESILDSAISRLDKYNDNLKRWLHPQGIFGNHRQFFEFVAIHIMVRDVRSQDWLNDLQKSHVLDKAEKLFKMLNAKPSDFNAAVGEYGDFRADPGAMVAEYHDCLRRCYVLSYIQLRSGWDDVVRDTAGSWTGVTAYLESDQCLVHVGSFPHFWSDCLFLNVTLISESVASDFGRYSGE